MKNKFKIIYTALFALLMSIFSIHANAQSCPDGSYQWSDMQALFAANNCSNAGCHGTGAGGLNLTSYAGFSAGGNKCGSDISTGTTLTDIINVGGVSCGGGTVNTPMNVFASGAIDATETAAIQAWIDAGAPESCPAAVCTDIVVSAQPVCNGTSGTFDIQINSITGGDGLGDPTGTYTVSDGATTITYPTATAITGLTYTGHNNKVTLTITDDDDNTCTVSYDVLQLECLDQTACDCTATDPFSINAQASGNGDGYTMIYVLTDASGTAISLNSTGSFGPLPDDGATYNVYAYNIADTDLTDMQTQLVVLLGQPIFPSLTATQAPPFDAYCYVDMVASFTEDCNCCPTDVEIVIDDQTICIENSTSYDLTSLEPAGFEGGVWTDAGGNTVSTVDIADGDTFTYTYTDMNDCTYSDMVAFVLNVGTSLVIDGINVCAEDATGYDLTQQEPPATTGTWAGVADPTNVDIVTGLYVYTYADENGCTSTVDANFIVLDAITFTLDDVSVCEGQSATLSPSGLGVGPYTYAWSDGSAGDTFTVGVSGTYALTVTDGNNCTGTGESIVTVNANPVVTINDQQICPAAATGYDLTTLEPAGQTGGTWSTATPTSVDINDGDSFSYTYTDENNCTGIDTIMFTINDNPTIDIDDQSICSFEATGYDLTLLEPAGQTGGFWSVATPTNVDINDGDSFTYSYIDANGCEGNVTFLFMVDAQAAPGFTLTDSYCENVTPEALPTTSDNGISGTWSPSVISTTSSGTYIFTPNADECAMTFTLAVTIEPETTPEFTLTDTYCENDTPEILPATSDNGISGTWFPDVISTASAGTYTFTPDDECATDFSILITINNNPIIDIADQQICPAAATGYDLTALEPAGQTGGTWSAATPANVDINDGDTFTYTYTDANGCTGSVTITFTISDNPTIDIADQSICTDEATGYDLTGLEPAAQSGGTWSAATPANVDINDGDMFTYTYTDANGCTGSVTITFTVNAGTILIIDGFACPSDTPVFIDLTESEPAGTTGTWDVADPTNVDISQGGSFTYTYTDDNGCTSELVLGFALLNGVTFTLNDASICEGETATLSPTGLDPAGTYTYLWSDGSNNADLTVSTAGDYSLTVTDGSDCSGTATATVTVSTGLDVSINDQSICPAAATGYDLTTLEPAGQTGGTWSVATPANVDINDGDTFTYTYTDANGCTGSATLAFTISDNPTIDIADQNICFDAVTGVDLTALEPAGQMGGTWSTPTPTNVDISLDGEQFTYTYTDANGCTGTVNVFFEVIGLEVGLPIIAPVCANEAEGFDLTIFNQGVDNVWTDQNGMVVDDPTNVNITSDITTFTSNYTSLETGCPGTQDLTLGLADEVQITATPTCSDAAEGQFFIDISEITGGQDPGAPIANYTIEAAGLSVNYTGTAISIGPFTYTDHNTPVTLAVTSSIGCTATYDVLQLNCLQQEVCDCTQDPNSYTINAQAAANGNGYSMVYVLVNNDNSDMVMVVNGDGTFSGLADNVNYTVHAFNVENADVAAFTAAVNALATISTGDAVLTGVAPFDAYCYVSASQSYIEDCMCEDPCAGFMVADIPDQIICILDGNDYDLTTLEPDGQTGGVWTDANGNVVSIVNIGINNDTFTYTYTENGCTDSDVVTIDTIFDTVIILENLTICADNAMGYNLTNLQTIEGGTWTDADNNIVTDPTNVDIITGASFTYGISENDCLLSAMIFTFTVSSNDIEVVAVPTCSGTANDGEFYIDIQSITGGGTDYTVSANGLSVTYPASASIGPFTYTNQNDKITLTITDGGCTVTYDVLQLNCVEQEMCDCTTASPTYTINAQAAGNGDGASMVYALVNNDNGNAVMLVNDNGTFSGLADNTNYTVYAFNVDDVDLAAFTAALNALTTISESDDVLTNLGTFLDYCYTVASAPFFEDCDCPADCSNFMVTLSVLDASCSGGGFISAVPNGTPPYDFDWSNGANSQDIGGLAAGTYSVMVTDADGCTASAEATVEDIPDGICDFQITNSFFANDPCKCNNDQTANGAGDGTFEETVTILAPAGLIIRATVLSTGILPPVNLSDVVTLPVEFFESFPGRYILTFNHLDREGYVLYIEYSDDGGATFTPAPDGIGGQLTYSNVCAYPVLVFNPPLEDAYCEGDGVITIGVEETSDNVNFVPVEGFPAVQLNNGVAEPSPIMFDPAAVGTATYTFSGFYDYESGPGTGGTVDMPAVSLNPCATLIRVNIPVNPVPVSQATCASLPNEPDLFRIDITTIEEYETPENLMYSINNGPFQSSSLFVVDEPGDYDLAVMDAVSACNFQLEVGCLKLLPIELASFEGNCQDGEYTLIWTTASESNVSHFLVERSIDGANYTSVGEVAATGNSTTTQTYGFKDATGISRQYYYRIRAIEFSGTETVSRVEVVACLSGGFGVLDVYPNPTQDEVAITYEVNDRDRVQLKLVDVLGRTMSEETLTPDIGLNRTVINMSNLASAVYFIVLDDGTQQSIEKVVKK